MSRILSVGTAGDRVMMALVAGLEAQFGRRAGAALARRFLEAEEVDFHWDARIEERWLGAYEGLDAEDIDLDRMAVIGLLDGEWFIANIIVDGEREAQGMLSRRHFSAEIEARKAWADAK